MNCLEANKINLARFLIRNGINPQRQKGDNLWFCSPFRNEKTASFKVDTARNLWYDFGINTGGGMIDLLCKTYNVDVSGALLILDGTHFDSLTSYVSESFSGLQEDSQNEPRIEILNLQPLQNLSLLSYLNGRKIKPAFAISYCREAYYRFNGNKKEYFALAFENDRHGFELRSKYFKGSNSPKAITTIPGKSRSSANLFEGFMDFLSALTYFKTGRAGCDTIVLNGVGFVEKFIDLMPKYSRINLFLDNDNAGKEAAKRILALRPDAINRSQIIYPGYKDFNELLLSQY